MMDLQYFLEMVDLKHRYGSNLRKFLATAQSPTLTFCLQAHIMMNGKGVVRTRISSIGWTTEKGKESVCLPVRGSVWTESRSDI